MLLLLQDNDFNNSGTIDIANDFCYSKRFYQPRSNYVANDLNATASNAKYRSYITDNLTIEASQFNNINGNNIGTISVDIAGSYPINQVGLITRRII